MNDFLPIKDRGKAIHLTFDTHQTVKHLIESIGVPHVEVGSIFASRDEVGFDYRPENGVRIDVYPPAPGCPIEPRFMIDNHLGRLAASLRMLGFDCLYENDFQDDEMADLLRNEDRILLSRDRRLLMRRIVRYGYCPRSLDPEEQLREVVARFDLAGRIEPFRRCLRCNQELEAVSKEGIADRLLPLTKRYYNEFVICRKCDQIYWKGSHYTRMLGVVNDLKK